MRATLAKPNDPVNKQRIRDAFGPNANLAEISKTVDGLHSGRLQVASANPAVGDKEKGRPMLAKVSLNKNKDGSFHSMGSAKIGSKFHDTTLLSDRQRAGTLIHEATHQQRRTGDDVITTGSKTTNMIIRAGDQPKLSASSVKGNGGCMCLFHFIACYRLILVTHRRPH